jgi:hypothetical protein
MITRKNCFWYLKLVSPLNVMARTRKYYLKNNYLTLRSNDKVPRRSLRYATHHLMVMHPHTKYNWPIWKDKKVMFRTSFAEKKRKKKIRLKQYVSLRSKERHSCKPQAKKLLKSVHVYSSYRVNKKVWRTDGQTDVRPLLLYPSPLSRGNKNPVPTANARSRKNRILLLKPAFSWQITFLQTVSDA